MEWNLKKTHFWSEIWKFRDAADINPFQELAMAAVSVLSLPHSNAEVESIQPDSELRNRMSLQTLNSILYIRYGLKLSGEACYEHQLPDNVLQLFGTSALSCWTCHREPWPKWWWPTLSVSQHRLFVCGGGYEKQNKKQWTWIRARLV